MSCGTWNEELGETVGEAAWQSRFLSPVLKLCKQYQPKVATEQLWKMGNADQQHRIGRTSFPFLVKLIFCADILRETERERKKGIGPLGIPSQEINFTGSLQLLLLRLTIKSKSCKSDHTVHSPPSYIPVNHSKVRLVTSECYFISLNLNMFQTLLPK